MLDDLPEVTYAFNKATRQHELTVDGHRFRAVRDVQIDDRVDGVPEVTVTFLVNRLNAPSNDARQAFRRQADEMFERLYQRHLAPRLDRIEQMLTPPSDPTRQ